ncbi:MAG TPA: tRNA (adenosine(37)-N6)-threonylcarbamoyltransferase complex transferase subunit TsaD [Firmicutes bacterium]|nr:tRNA (adenosine(37)-N6)-threonylcarbamoyltransferase complex transferase subunit TsaD [Bacillota bacterium]
MAEKDVYILGIESSCDETSAAVVLNGRKCLSNVIASQIELHRRFGGVVPEIAGRNHLLAVMPVVDKALSEAGIGMDKLDAIAVTYGPGLIGCLLVGVAAAKAMAYALGIPLIKTDHIQGHIAANFIAFPQLAPPLLALVASGGHTSIVSVEDYNTFVPVSATLDDAIGESFDKVARILGLPYPGGPEIDRHGRQGKANIKFCPNLHVRGDLAYSFSGLKTAVVNYVHNLRQRGEEIPVDDICASFTAEAVGYTVDTFIRCAKERGKKNLALAGGVAANTHLRSQLAAECEKNGFTLFVPPPVLCTDNAAMIAARGYYSFVAGKDEAGLDLNAKSVL